MAKHSGTGRVKAAKRLPKVCESQEQHADLLEEESPAPTVCLKHPRVVYFDGRKCPACQAEKEFKNLTRGMLFSNRTKPANRKS